MEHIGDGTLKELMDKKFGGSSGKNRFTDREASQLIKSILEAVDYIHDKDISHRDLKPQNILIGNSKDMSSVKLIDFGLGDKQRTNDERCGTYMYMAPEIVNRDSRYTKSVDLWAIGIIMH